MAAAAELGDLIDTVDDNTYLHSPGFRTYTNRRTQLDVAFMTAWGEAVNGSFAGLNGPWSTARGKRQHRPRWLSASLSVILALTLLGQQPTPAAAAPAWQAPKPKDVAGVPVKAYTPEPAGKSTHAQSNVVTGSRTVVWPHGTAIADLDAAQRAAASAVGTRAGMTGPVRARAGNLPVTIAAVDGPADVESQRLDGPQGKVSVTVHDRNITSKAGVHGLLISAKLADQGAGSTTPSLQVDYASFAGAYGDWASRLRLFRLPACALSTPDVAICQTRTPLGSSNDTANSVLSAQVTLNGSEPLVIAAAASASSDNGDFTATSLAPAGQWQVSTQTGDFSWSYPLRMPPALGGPAPSISLAHSSGSLDGRTALTNNQGSWIGDGWDSWPGYIERRYASCADDNPSHQTGDQCWFSNNATLSLNGHAGELVETTTPNVWRLRNDDGTRVEKLTDAARANGDNDNEYWKVTTTDGVQYFFGYHKLPNWTSGKETTDSTWTVPVYGNNSGEPCYNATFANAWCNQAWRWNLDYVVDPNANTLAYFYEAETGAYGRDNTPSQRTTYHRGGYLHHIDYGMRSGAEYSQNPPLKVVFDTKERCLAGAGCWTGTAWTSDPVTANWLDSPWDQYCKAAPCTDQLSPTFWTAYRLNKVTTQVRNGTSTYADVESWTLRHEFINAGTGESTPMWLRGITRTGHVTTAVSDPEITFDTGAEPLPNRVDGPADGLTGLYRWRIKNIHTESGGDINIFYSGPDCTRTTLPTPETNTKRCMPSFYSPTGTPQLDWFHKYVVIKVELDDKVTDQLTQVTQYDYLDAPAWAYNRDELTKDKYRTWGDWRGYGQVQVRTGDPAGAQTAVEHRYLRGMDGDRLNQSGGTKDVWVTDSWAGSIEDHEALRGFQLQSIIFDGVGGTEISSTRNDPWLGGPTATRTRNNITTNAWMMRTDEQRTRSPLSAGGYRYTKTVTAYNTDGLPVTLDDLGDENVATDQTCTRTKYARNDTIWMIDRVSQTETLSLSCAGQPEPATPSTVLKRSRNFYDAYEDDSSFGAPPTRGNVIRTEELDKFTGSTPIYTRVATIVYDGNGRPTSQFDPRGYPTGTVYTTANGGLVTQTAVTNPKSHLVTTWFEPAWGSPTKITDPNGAVTDLTYDGLGRTTAVWVPGRPKATYPTTPSSRFTYLVRNTGGPTAVTSEVLMPTGTTYKKTVELFDGFLRQRQRQEQATGGGRLLTETLFNTRGDIASTSLPYWDSTNTPAGTDLGQPQIPVPSTTQHSYDGAGRKTAEILVSSAGGGTELWRTTHTYDGERVNITPPSGGTGTTTIVNAKGQQAELRQYKNPADVGSDVLSTFDKTTYAYTPLNQLAAVTDVTGSNIWSYSYDLRGRQTRAVGPDKGTTDTTYDAAGNVETVTAPLGTGTATIAYTYDELGRKTSMRNDTVTGTVRADWLYDTLANGKGKLTSSTRYSGGNAYTVKTDTFDAYGRPTSTSVVLPAAESTLCAAVTPNTCTYTTAISYRANGQPHQVTMPAAADLGSEKFTNAYNDIGAPLGLTSPLQIYVGLNYDKLGQINQRNLGTTGSKVFINYAFDEPTRRLSNTLVTPENKPEAANYTYTYHNAGSIKKIVDAPVGGTSDTQCYTIDYLQRLTEAWTPESGSCTSAPTAWSQIDGSAYPYWHTYTLAPNGNRTSEVRHGATNTTYAYTYPAAGSARPHAVTNVTASGGASWSRNYTYDDGGNTKTRPTTAGATQTLTWDREGKVLSSVEGGTTVSYLHDADGKRLTRTDATGKTLYLPGGTEVRYTTSGSTKKATRYYTHAGTTIAVRTATTFHWVVGDHHGTAEITIKASDLSVAKRRMLPYGEQRGVTTGTWATGMDKGFVGGTNDPTGLTHLGAREYDPFIGQFISVDPVTVLTAPQQIHGYAYGHSNPSTMADPSGLCVEDLCGNANDRYQQAYDRFFGNQGDPTTIDLTVDGPIKRGHGIVVIKMFIIPGSANGFAHGDGRDFSADPKAGFRVAVVWNTETGKVTIEVAGSSNMLWDDEPLPFGPDNEFKVGVTEAGGLKIEAHSKNPQLPSFATPAIDMTITVDVDGSDSKVHIQGDPYPSVEVIQYRAGRDPRFLAQSVQAGFGGPALNLMPLAVDRNETWVNGSGPGRYQSWDPGWWPWSEQFCPSVFVC